VERLTLPCACCARDITKKKPGPFEASIIEKKMLLVACLRDLLRACCPVRAPSNCDIRSNDARGAAWMRLIRSEAPQVGLKVAYILHVDASGNWIQVPSKNIRAFPRSLAEHWRWDMCMGLIGSYQPRSGSKSHWYFSYILLFANKPRYQLWTYRPSQRVHSRVESIGLWMSSFTSTLVTNQDQCEICLFCCLIMNWGTRSEYTVIQSVPWAGAFGALADESRRCTWYARDIKDRACCSGWNQEFRIVSGQLNLDTIPTTCKVLETDRISVCTTCAMYIDDKGLQVLICQVVVVHSLFHGSGNLSIFGHWLLGHQNIRHKGVLRTLEVYLKPSIEFQGGDSHSPEKGFRRIGLWVDFVRGFKHIFTIIVQSTSAGSLSPLLNDELVGLSSFDNRSVKLLTIKKASQSVALEACRGMSCA